MQDSRIIEVNGEFLAAAVSLPGTQGWRIVAADSRVEKLDGTIAPSLNDVRRLARQAYLSTRTIPAFVAVAR